MEHANNIKKNLFHANEANVVKCSTKLLILDIYEVSFQRKYQPDLTGKRNYITKCRFRLNSYDVNLMKSYVFRKK